MTSRSLRFILPVSASLFIACGSDDRLGPSGSEPKHPAEFTALEISPAELDLGTAAPGNTFQLTVRSRNRAGFATERTSEATYSSRAPAIAEVSSGFVTAVAPGTTEITAALTLGGVSRTASMRVTVHDRDYSDLTGIYDLSAVITSAGGWGYEGYRYTAVARLFEKSGPSWIGGTYADLQFVAPGGESEFMRDGGSITGSTDSNGQPIFVLHGDPNWSGLIFTVGTVTPGFIDGSWYCCDGFSGRFTAERR